MSADRVAAAALPETDTGRWLGAAAALFTVLLWAAGLVITRFGVTGALSMWDVIFLRVGPPALLLAPILLRLLHSPPAPSGAVLSAGRRRFWMTVMVAGAGLPFILVGTGGMVLAPAAHAGALMPGSMPLFAALFAALLLGESFNRQRRIGMLLMLLGAFAVGGWQIVAGSSDTWRGDLLFICAGAMWACYTIGLKKTGLGPWQATALVYVVSFLIYAPIYLLWFDSRLLSVPIFEVGIQIAQSVGSGLLSMAAYSFAVRRLGAAKAAAFGALTPALTALLAIPVLGEWPETVTWIGIVAVSLGVALANGAFARYNRTNHQRG